jgi:hypothetical protein
LCCLIRTGEERLQVLGILEGPDPGLPLRQADKIRYTSALTPLGRVVASFPLAPRHATVHYHLLTVLRIRDILVWIRILIPGSLPLTNGSGFNSGSDSFLQ